MTTLPETLPGHWDTPEGREQAVEYLGKRRTDLHKGSMSDMHLANAQDAAKQRIRWLSAQLADAHALMVRSRNRLRSSFMGRGSRGGSCGLCGSMWNGEDEEHDEDCIIARLNAALARMGEG